MSEQPIWRDLEDVLAQCLQDPHFENTGSLLYGLNIGLLWGGYSELGNRLLQVLNDNVFEAVNRKVFYFGCCGNTVGLDTLGIWLLHNARSKSPQVAVEKLRRMLTDGKVETVRAVVLSGLRVDRDYSIDGDMILVPFDKLVDFDAVHLVNYIHNMDRGRGELHPKSALIRCGKTNFSAEPTECEKQKLYQDAYEESLFGAVLCLVCSHGAPAPFGIWSLIAYSAPFSGHIDRGHSYESEIKRPYLEDELGEREITSAIDLFEKLKKLPEWLCSKIEISLHRLRQSLNTKDEVQRAVDLGVSLESILVKDSDSNGKVKQVKFMGALLFSDDYRERLDAVDLLVSVYDLRSQAVHSGCFSGKTKDVGGESIPAGDLIKAGQMLVKKAIIKVIEKGEYPDAEFEKCLKAGKILEH